MNDHAPNKSLAIGRLIKVADVSIKYHKSMCMFVNLYWKIIES